MPTHRTNECHKYKTWRNVDVVASVVDDEEAEDDIIIFLLRRRRRLYRREKSEEFPHFLFATRRFSMSFARRLFALSVFSLVVALFNARQVNAFALDVGFNKTECVFKVRFLLFLLLLLLLMMCLCARLFPGERSRF